MVVIFIFDLSYIICVGNDYGFDFIFFCYVEVVGKKGDVLLGIFIFGNFVNVLKVVEVVCNKGMKVIGLMGKDGGKMYGLCDVEIRVLYIFYVDCVQEIYIKVIYSLIDYIEFYMEGQELFFFEEFI